MNIFRSTILTLLLTLLGGPVCAQDSLTWDEFINEYAADDENGTAWSDAYEVLSELHEHPMNINTATKEELGRLPFLSDQQIEDIQAYVYSYGAMKSAGELLMIKSLDYATRQKLMPFIYIGNPAGKKMPSLREMLDKGNHELLASASIPFYQRKGDINGYAGYKYKHSFRYNFVYSRYLKLGIVGAQGAGEPFFTGKNKWGYDYYSYYLILHDLNRIKTLALGRYKLAFGMGLVVNSSFSLGKMAALSALGRTGSGISAHSSQSEYGYFNGAAATIQLVRDITVSTFASYRHFDATLNEDGSMATILTAGYHRTLKELEKKNNSVATDMGGNINFAYKDIHVGMTAVYTSFDRALQPDKRPLYKRIYPEGTRFLNASVDYGYVHRRFSFRGETATRKGGGIATLNLLSLNMNSKMNVMVVQRYYSYKYSSLYSNAFSEGGSIQNESGIYFGANWRPAYEWNISAYTDWFYSAWPRYQVSQASHGCDNLLSIGYENKKWGAEARYRLHIRQKDNKDGNALEDNACQRMRLRANLKMNRHLTAFAQLDATRTSSGGASEYGYMVNGKASYMLSGVLSVAASCGYFHTDSYESRVCIYEQGLLYHFSFPSFYGEGTRLAVALKGNISSRLMLTAKLGITDYFDRNHISSGMQEINHSSQTDCDLQLRWKF